MKSLYIHGHCFPLARLTYPSSGEEWLPNSNCREHTRNKAYRMRVQGPKPCPSWSQTNHTWTFAWRLPNLTSLSDTLTYANSVSFLPLDRNHTTAPGIRGMRRILHKVKWRNYSSKPMEELSRALYTKEMKAMLNHRRPQQRHSRGTAHGQGWKNQTWCSSTGMTSRHPRGAVLEVANTTLSPAFLPFREVCELQNPGPGFQH